jgi:hypothetical protein
MMKKFTILLIFTLITLTTALSQKLLAAEDGNLLISFNGGLHDMRFISNSALLSGIGVYETSAGIGITTLRPTPAGIYWNPAGLAFLERGKFLVEALPGITYSPDMSETINSEVDGALADFDTTPSTTKVYPDFSLSSGQGGQTVSAVALAFPYKSVRLGIAYHRAFNLDLNLISAGVENTIQTQEEDPNDNATFYSRTDINMLLNFNADVVSFALGRKMGDSFGWGLTLSRLNAVTTITGLMSPEAVFTRRGIEKAFNDPTAGWQNDFYSLMDGEFIGGGWGIKAGVAYQPNSHFCMNLLYSQSPTMELEGEMTILQYFYPALNMNPDEAAGEETFDLDNVENFSQPTETILADNQTSEVLTINTPSSISFGIAYRGLSLTYTSYSEELSYSYDLARDGNWITYARGVQPIYGVLLGFDMKAIRLSLGAIAVDEIVRGYVDNDGNPVEPSTGLMLPRFSMGTGFKIGKDWKMDVLLLSVPDLMGSLLKVGATYEF